MSDLWIVFVSMLTILYFLFGTVVSCSVFVNFNKSYIRRDLNIKSLLLSLFFIPFTLLGIIIKLISNVTEYISDLDFINVPLSDIFRKNK